MQLRYSSNSVIVPGRKWSYESKPKAEMEAVSDSEARLGFCLQDLMGDRPLPDCQHIRVVAMRVHAVVNRKGRA